MSPEQQKDNDRLDRYISSEFLAPIMNDTKWNEAILALQSIEGYYVQFRVRCLRDVGAEICHWDLSFPYHLPSPLKTIEWLDINPIVSQRIGALVSPTSNDFRVEICASLSRSSIPYEELAGIIRIRGYKRLAKFPS